MKRFRYWFTRIAKKKWRECRSFCASCEYYQECKDDFEGLNNDVPKKILKAYKRKRVTYTTKVQLLLFENYFDMIDPQSRRCKNYGAIGGLT